MEWGKIKSQKKKIEKKEEKEECCKHRKSKILYKCDSSLFPTSIIKYGQRYRKKKREEAAFSFHQCRVVWWCSICLVVILAPNKCELIHFYTHFCYLSRLIRLVGLVLAKSQPPIFFALSYYIRIKRKWRFERAIGTIISCLLFSSCKKSCQGLCHLLCCFCSIFSSKSGRVEEEVWLRHLGAALEIVDGLSRE